MGDINSRVQVFVSRVFATTEHNGSPTGRGVQRFVGNSANTVRNGEYKSPASLHRVVCHTCIRYNEPLVHAGNTGTVASRIPKPLTAGKTPTH